MGVLQEREAHPSKRLWTGALSNRTLRSADVNCSTPKLGAISQPRNGLFRFSCIHAFTVKADSFSAFRGRGNFRFRELANELAGKYFEKKMFSGVWGNNDLSHLKCTHSLISPSCPLPFLHNQQKLYCSWWSGDFTVVAGAMPTQKVWRESCSAPFCGWPPPPGKEAAAAAVCSILWPWPVGQVRYCVMLFPKQCCVGLFLFVLFYLLA